MIQDRDTKRLSPCWKLKAGDKIKIDNGQRTEEVEIIGLRKCKCNSLQHNQVVYKGNSGKKFETSFKDFETMMEK